MSDLPFQVNPFSAALGAELSGLDLAEPLSEGTAEALRQALARHLLIVFRDQTLTPAQYVAFARALGEVAVEPFIATMAGYPEIIEVIKAPDEARVQVFGQSWHSDFTFLEAPPAATLLYARAVPAGGGDTIYVNTQQAFAALSEGMQALLGGLNAVHEGGRFYGASGDFYDKADQFGDRQLAHIKILQRPEADGEVVHPVVRRHPVTGLPGLFVNEAYSLRLAAMTGEESRPLLEYLYDWCRRPEFSCRLRWRPGSLAVWDNRATLHKAINDYDGEGRHHWRITLAGDRPQAWRA